MVKPLPLALDYRFKQPELLKLALTHRSAGRPHNERLEFLGDAILGALIAEALYGKFPLATEGQLTRLRAQLVCESSLAELARHMNLSDSLHLGPGELRTGGFRRESILADAFEAIVGAIFVDQGWEACRAAILPLMQEGLEKLNGAKLGKDPKTELQELLQGKGLSLPLYELVEARGNDHEKIFVARCVVQGSDISATGEAGNRRQAESRAAKQVLELIKSVGVKSLKAVGKP